MITTRTFDSTDALILETEELLRKTLSTSGNLMLSGGSTPYVIYNRLAAAPCPVHPQRNLFLSDERMEPFSSEKNNAHNLLPMLQALDCHGHFLQVDTKLSVRAAADHFDEGLERMNTVDLGLLGMGTDGHTAGFSTKEQANMKNGPLALYTDRPDGMQGVSVTPAFLKRVERIILLVTGESKRAIINTLLTHPQSIPAGIALGDHPNIELWTDIRPEKR
ncbi:6-phosphogluconolactonase [Pontiella desulfatans]|uniref:6-phosphogluconolactonase n=1 Tax=Pontiella desulfatans TaxID=2750659 RepID=A0A6C2U3I1_PONDE|nr:6-phosphogluconolactonase [Pontiella desulfatans]VGO14425.1 6-phosphogluconolactonase [Pontiella desulfatans]